MGEPRVGLRGAGQPWALGRNPVGIGGAMGVFVEVRWRVTRWGWVVDGGGNLVVSLVPSSTAGYRPALLPG